MLPPLQHLSLPPSLSRKPPSTLLTTLFPKAPLTSSNLADSLFSLNFFYHSPQHVNRHRSGKLPKDMTSQVESTKA